MSHRDTARAVPSPRSSSQQRAASAVSSATRRPADLPLFLYTATLPCGVTEVGVVRAATLDAAADAARRDVNRLHEADFAAPGDAIAGAIADAPATAVASCSLAALTPSAWCDGAFDTATEAHATRVVRWVDPVAAARDLEHLVTA